MTPSIDYINIAVAVLVMAVLGCLFWIYITHVEINERGNVAKGKQINRMINLPSLVVVFVLLIIALLHQKDSLEHPLNDFTPAKKNILSN